MEKIHYPIQEVEAKWKKRWNESAIFKTDFHTSKPKYYVLEMFSYPSGDLHIGHLRNYVIVDLLALYKKLQGYEVLHPIGWDSFGLPAENAAIKKGVSPEKWTLKNIETSRNTLKLMGLSYDWDTEITTCLPDYYKWTQWLFLKLYEKGLAYRSLAYVNWCPDCQTVIANEQVIDGACERCHTLVIKRELEQWYFKITDYAQRLLDDLDKLDKWPSQLKTMQRNWLGRSEGAEIIFKLEDENITDKAIPIFTTRPDTVYGVTFMAIAPENPLVEKLISGTEYEKPVREYVKQALNKTEIERLSTVTEKDGVFTGKYVINPLNGDKVQLWVADYVLASYGTGIVMAVPAHDQRDFEFAKKYDIPIKIVINPLDEELKVENMTEAYTDTGIMTNSDIFDGTPSKEGIKKVIKYCQEKGIGGSKVNFKLRDWLISRQRYWGAPIPMIHCDDCGVISVPYKDLPVLLPPEKDVDFMPKGKSPLASVKSYVNTICPKCGKPAKRDSDTMDTFVCSSWYFFRYLDAHNDKEIFSKELAKKWLPIDQYIGGIEHATGHCLYARFISKFLYDLGYSKYDEPAKALFNHGMVHQKMADGTVAMMSKRTGAVEVRPFVAEYGSDIGRLVILFAGPPDKDMIWSDEGLSGITRFVNRIYRLIMTHKELIGKSPSAISYHINELPSKQAALYRKLNQTIKKVNYDLDNFGYNTAIAAMMELVNDMYKYENPEEDEIFASTGRFLIKLLAPFAPVLAEELWEQIGNTKSIFIVPYDSQPYISYDKEAIQEENITLVLQINGKVRAKVEVPVNTSKEELEKIALANDKIQDWIKDKKIRKVIVVPKKLVNTVV